MSFRVIIVEDEYRIAELLVQLGHWDALGLQIADVCYDGLVRSKAFRRTNQISF